MNSHQDNHLNCDDEDNDVFILYPLQRSLCQMHLCQALKISPPHVWVDTITKILVS